MNDNPGLFMGLVCAFPFIWGAIWFWVGRWSKGLKLTRVEDATRYIRADQPASQPPPGAIQRVKPGKVK